MNPVPHQAAAPQPLRARAVLVARALGRIAYDEALALQETLVAGRIAGVHGDQLLLLEHPPVYTLGRGADTADLRGAPERVGVPVFRIGRGGGVTFHGPGQMVAYPIVRLRGGGRDVHGYVRGLEQALIATCAAFGVPACARSGQPGVWADGRKIASIGIGVRRGVACHGVALNVATDLTFFGHVISCRSAETAMGNLGDLVAGPLDVAAVGRVFAARLAEQLHRSLEWSTRG